MAAGSSTSLNKETVTLKLPSGESIDAIVPSGLDDAGVKAYVQMRRPDLLGPPAGIPAPKPTPMQSVDALGKPQSPYASTAGLPGYVGDRAVTDADLAPGAIVGGTAATMMGGSTALPFLRTFATQHPLIATMAAQELIHQAREKLPGGQYIPAAAEWLPFLIGGSKAKEGEVQKPTEPSAPSTDQAPGRPYKPDPRYEPPPQPEPIPERSGPLLLKGEAQKPTSMGKLPWIPNLEKAVGNEPYSIKPGVPMRQQGLPAKESSAVDAFHYDSANREFHVQPKGGSTGYVYGDVSPEDAQGFADNDSKGKAWQQMKNNPLVGKIVNGKRVAIKPVSRQGDGEDLTDILTKSLQAARSPQE